MASPRSSADSVTTTKTVDQGMPNLSNGDLGMGYTDLYDTKNHSSSSPEDACRVKGSFGVPMPGEATAHTSSSSRSSRKVSPMAPSNVSLITGSENDGKDGHDLVLSPFENLPTELTQQIATNSSTDFDLRHLALTSPTFAIKTNSVAAANIWMNRFLTKFDYPVLESTLEFAFAYQHRQLVLRRFDTTHFSQARRQRSRHQLEVVRDIIQESYNKSRTYLPRPKTSKNLTAFSSPNLSPWVLKLTEAALYGNARTKYGWSNPLFDTVQVMLSHLVLSKSAVRERLSSSRDNYDLARVYNYNKSSAMLLEKLPDNPHKTTARDFRSTRFPHLRSPPPEPQQPRYKIDMHTLLHIRNFWQRHFIVEKDVKGIGENTFASMARHLAALGKNPREWDRPLQEHVPVNTNWYGHYSCLHPWPKSRADLEERQTCAEDWENVNPMTLDFETSSENKDGAFWPPVFSSIPIFADIMPDEHFHKNFNLTYLRGTVPFMDVSSYSKRRRSTSASDTDPQDEYDKWHPFVSSRVHGFVVDIPDSAVLTERLEDVPEAKVDKVIAEETIPGWKHICMVMYKPPTGALLATLEHAEENFGGTAGTQLMLNTHTVNDHTASDNTDNPIIVAATTTQNATATGINNVEAATIDDTTDDLDPTEAQIEEALRKLLAHRINSYSTTYTALLDEQARKAANNTPTPSNPYVPSYDIPKPKSTPTLPPLFSPAHIRDLEDSHSGAQYLDWNPASIEYAYAYEGIIIPGGKIMLGRWWRIHGEDGMGPSKEVGPDGAGIDVRPVAPENPGSSDGAGDDEADNNTGKGKAKAMTKRKKRYNPARANGKGKRKAEPNSDVRVSRRPSKQKRRKLNDYDTDDGSGAEPGHEKADGSDTDEYGYGHGDEEVEEDVPEQKEVEYEFVTMHNGVETRAVNASKGLERGPFVFWSG